MAGVWRRRTGIDLKADGLRLEAEDRTRSGGRWLAVGV